MILLREFVNAVPLLEFWNTFSPFGSLYKFIICTYENICCSYVIGLYRILLGGIFHVLKIDQLYNGLGYTLGI